MIERGDRRRKLSSEDERIRGRRILFGEVEGYYSVKLKDIIRRSRWRLGSCERN